MLHLKKYFSLFMLFAWSMAFSQNEQTKWYFGQYTGLDFMTSPPGLITSSAMNAFGDCASIADGNGNLLFYTDGVTVYNQSNAIMANGSGLNGNNNSCQTCIIARKPGSINLYYIFTVQGQYGLAGLNYSIVDMSLAAGQGSVTVKNASLYSGSCSEQITGTMHCNGIDIWIVVHESSSLNFRSYLLTSAGVNTTAVVSTVVAGYGHQGSMKFSPNGKKLGAASDYQGVFLYDFDNSTGVVSNPLRLNPNSSSQCFGCEFSPDGSKFYAGYLPVISYFSSLMEWDLCAGAPSAIVVSGTAVSGTVLGLGSMQVAPNGQIYISSGSNLLHIITNPNNGPLSCGFTTSAVATATTNTYSRGLPNFIKIPTHVPPAPFTYTVSNNYGCQAAGFTSVHNPSLTTGCPSAGYSLVATSWDFDDPASGSANTSFLANPTHTFTTPGTYTVQEVLYYTCGGYNDTIREVVNVNTPCVTVSSTSITCASLGSATAIATSTVGSFSYTWMPSAQTGSVAVGLAPGTYSLYIFYNGTGTTFTNSVTFLPPIPLTGQLSNSSNLPCNGVPTGTAAITNLAGGSSNQSYAWSLNGGPAAYTTASVSGLGAGTWNVIVTDALTGCQINNTFFITQPPPLALNLSASSPSACVSASVVLTGTNSGGTPGSGAGYTYTWTNGSVSDTYTVSQMTGGTYVYTLNSTDGNQCLISNTILVGFVNNPTITLSDIVVCQQHTGTLTPVGAISYIWNTGATGSTFTDTPLSATQYSVIGSALGCTATASASMIVIPLPVPVLNNNSPVCENGALSFSASGGQYYYWNGPNGFISNNQSCTISPAGIAANGTYTVTVTAANGCTASTSQTLIVNALPSLTISPASSSICLNTNSVTLTASGTATLFNWEPSSTATSTLNVSPSATQIYTLTGSLNGCTVNTTATVNVVPPPNPFASLSSPTTCAEAFNGSPNTITLTAGGANTYTISTPNDIYNSNPGGPITNLNTLPPHIPGASTATLYGSNGVCTVSSTAVFSIIPNPTVSVSNPTPVICAGQSFTYTSAGADSYVWSGGTPGQTLYTTGNVAVSSPSINSVFSVYGGSIGCNSAIQSTTITVNPLPTLTLSPHPAITCINSPLTLYANGTGTLYNWSPPYYLNTTQGSSVITTPPAQQSYTVVASLNSCTASAMITVSVLPLPEPVITSTQSAICIGEQLAMLASGGLTYTWTVPNNTHQFNSNLNLIASSLAYAGVYTLATTDHNGCIGVTSITIDLQNTPFGYLKNNILQNCVPFCSDFTFVPTNYSLSDLNPVSWQINNKTLPGTNNFNYCFTKAGQYFISGALSTKAGCINTVTMTIDAYEAPKADFDYSPKQPVENTDEVKFTNTSAGEKLSHFNWYFVNNDQNNRSTNKDPNYVFENAGIYPVALIVKNEWGCADSIVKTITVAPDFAIYVPDAFTPNEDGRNESFYPVTRGVKLISFSIYDRWGERLFSASSPEAGWDGTYKGEPCKEDVYVWKLEATGINDQQKSMNGFVTLYR